MTFDRKHLPVIHARPTAHLVFATNQIPAFHDRSEGIWRRMIPIPFRVTIPPDRQDPHLADTLRAELAGIFNWSLEGLRRLKHQGCFREPEACRASLEDHRQECNSAREFLLERVVAVSGGKIVCGDLYETYRLWAAAQGFHAVDIRQLGKEVSRLFSGSRRAVYRAEIDRGSTKALAGSRTAVGRDRALNRGHLRLLARAVLLHRRSNRDVLCISYLQSTFASAIRRSRVGKENRMS